jgi:CHAT domain-containing protein
LPGVAGEVELVRRLLPGAAVLAGPAATRERVLAALPRTGWVHFAGHGDQDMRDPSRGALRLYDGPLPVAELAALRHTGEFAYLSGCKTALGGADLPDEAITLAAALQYTGFRHVIATLWSVGDEHAAQVATDVYTMLAGGGRLDAGRSAAALHRAVRALRERAPLSAWTPFVHLGP